MKLIQAYIKPHKLSEVSLALHNVEGLTGMSVYDVSGCGREKEEDSPHSIEEDLVDFVPHVKLEIFCHDEQIDDIITTIQTSAHTGLRGDGKIYILEVDNAVRISTGEQGEIAI